MLGQVLGLPPSLDGLTIDECGFSIDEVSLVGATARVQAHIKNQQPSIRNHPEILFVFRLV